MTESNNSRTFVLMSRSLVEQNLRREAADLFAILVDPINDNVNAGWDVTTQAPFIVDIRPLVADRDPRLIPLVAQMVKAKYATADMGWNVAYEPGTPGLYTFSSRAA